MKRILFFITLTALFFACEDEDILNNYPAYSNEDSETELKRLEKYVNDNFSKFQTNEDLKGFYYIPPVNPSRADSVVPGDTVVINLTQRFTEGGPVLLTTYQKEIVKGYDKLDIPFLAMVNNDEMLNGINLALTVMRVGDKAKVIFSSDYGFKDVENIYGIGPFSSLECDIELLGVGAKSKQMAQMKYVVDYLEANDTIENYSYNADSTMLFKIINKGDVLNNYIVGENINVDYGITYLNNFKTYFKSDQNSGVNYTFTKGANDLPQKFNECIDSLGRKGEIKAFVFDEVNVDDIDFLIFNSPFCFDIKIK
jgi:hypothetical protein